MKPDANQSTDKPAMRSAEDWAMDWDAKTSDHAREVHAKFIVEIQQDAIKTHSQHVKHFLSEMYAIMVDPCETTDDLKIEDLCKILTRRAEEDREAIASQRAEPQAVAELLDALEALHCANLKYIEQFQGRLASNKGSVAYLLREKVETAIANGKAMLSAAPTPPTVSAWQTIETAPKDGTEIILLWSGIAITGFYLDNSKTELPWEGFRPHSGVLWPIGNPTHWMPLPAAPKP
jgi:hypothetical protein